MADFAEYGGKRFPMQGFTLDQAKSVMARHFPELAEPKIETKKDGEDTIHVFTKQAGRKGAGRGAARRVCATAQTQNVLRCTRARRLPARLVRWAEAGQPPRRELTDDELAPLSDAINVMHLRRRLAVVGPDIDTDGAVLL